MHFSAWGRDYAPSSHTSLAPSVGDAASLSVAPEPPALAGTIAAFDRRLGRMEDAIGELREMMRGMQGRLGVVAAEEEAVSPLSPLKPAVQTNGHAHRPPSEEEGRREAIAAAAFEEARADASEPIGGLTSGGTLGVAARLRGALASHHRQARTSGGRGTAGGSKGAGAGGGGVKGSSRSLMRGLSSGSSSRLNSRSSRETGFSIRSPSRSPSRAPSRPLPASASPSTPSRTVASTHTTAHAAGHAQVPDGSAVYELGSLDLFGDLYEGGHAGHVMGVAGERVAWGVLLPWSRVLLMWDLVCSTSAHTPIALALSRT